MNWFARLFGAGSKSKNDGAAVEKESFLEKDSRGTRHDTESLADSYWGFGRLSSRRKDPFLLYSFDSEHNARQALLELPCIHVARDSGKLICDRVLIFGYYATTGGKYEAVVCGDDLTHELWQRAKASFTKHGGRPRGEGELEPERHAAPRQDGKVTNTDRVSFVREDRRQRNGTTSIYRVHKGPDATSAQAYLADMSVTRPQYYIVVETPEGTYGRDIKGMYKE